MATFTFRPAAQGADVITGTADDDLAIAVNDGLNAGDLADLLGGTDTVRHAVDASLAANVGGVRGDFSGFTFTNVEIFEIVNDSILAQGIRYDMSSSPGINRFRITNSSNTTTIDQVSGLPGGGLPVIEISRTTNPGNADVNVGFAADALSGANDTLTLEINGTNVDDIDIGTANTANPLDPINGGVETLQVNVTGGSSVIDNLVVGANRINLTGAGAVTVNNRLDDSTRTVVSTGTGDRDFDLGNNAGVSYQGDSGRDNITGGSGNDTINTADNDDTVDAGAGNDSINAGGGNNVVRTGTGTNTVIAFSGNDRIFAQGTNDTIDAGQGDDVIDISATTAGTRTTVTGGDGSDRLDGGTNFDASNSAAGDIVDLGTGFDILEVPVGLNDAQFFNARNIEALALQNGVVTNLSGGAGGLAQAAGITFVYFASGNQDDTLNASTYTVGMVISNGQEYAGRGLGGNDTVTTGSGADAFLWRGNNALTNADALNAGSQATAGRFDIVDGLYLGGDTTITAGGGFSNFEYIALETTRNSIYAGLAGDSGAQYNLTLTNANAPTSGRILVNGLSLQADTDGAGPLVQETVTLDTTAVTNFAVDVFTGQGDDVITSGIAGEVIVTAGGNDRVTDGGGDDLIDTGVGNDVVILQSGNNRVTDEGGNNTITLGTGNDRLLLGGGNDTVVGGANLTSADAIPGFGGGTDTLRVFGRTYADGDFAGVGGGLETLEVGSRAGDVGGVAGDETNVFSLGANVAATQVQTVRANGTGASDIRADGISRGLTFDLTDGGNDRLLATQGSDTIIAGVGDQAVFGGNGDDRLRVNGIELNFSDIFSGGAGADVVELDNSGGLVVANVNLSQVTSVERYEYSSSGERGSPDPDANSLTFGNAPAATVTTLTNIAVDLSRLTDAEDSSTVTLDASLLDADFAFTITGSSTLTTVVKSNAGTNNNINFIGGTGVDVFDINGGDLGSTTTFNGGAGDDIIRQRGGVISDDSYVSVDNVEILEAAMGSAINASLGDEASASGLRLVRGTDMDDNLFLDAAFARALRVELGGGNDTVNGAAATGSLTVAARDAQVTTADDLDAGAGAGDVLELTATNGTADITNTTGFETVTVIGDSNAATSTGSTLRLDTQTAEVSGGQQTISTTGFGSTDVFRLGGDAATAALTVNSGAGNDVLRTGSAADTINAGDGNNQISSGAGGDTINSGAGADRIDSGVGVDLVNAGGGDDVVSGGDDGDTLNGEGGNDSLRGGLGVDSINGGAGTDRIEGGGGRDILSGGTDADTFFYRNVADSAGTLGRDTITDFQSGSDRVDVRALTDAIAGQTIVFRGNFDNFTDSQGAVRAGDGNLDAVYQRDANILWFDTNNDGALNANDLQIVLTGVTTLTGADVFDGGTVNPASPDYAAFEAQFTTIPMA